MSTIFAAGSRSINTLDDEPVQRITNIIAYKHHVIVGDADGADTIIQRHLVDAAYYHDVEVFCSGPRCRNNLGNWRTHHIRPPRDATGFQFYAAKDRAMAEAADFGLMIWDGTSPGTILNILRLLRTGKAAVLITSGQTSHTFKSIHDWQTFLGSCRPQLVRSLKQRATPDEWPPSI
ncbi:MAG TPA: hypothetical protein VMU78_09355 [Methylocella sp.]|nr:hypothetical protein [Methylocella sp.]